MSRGIMELYVEFDDIRGMDCFIRWAVGWLYMNRFEIKYTETECGGCKWYTYGDFVSLDTWKLEFEGDVDMFDLAMTLGLDVMMLLREFKIKMKIGICKGDECIDINLRDIERWWNEEAWVTASKVL
jgi:hypothetical protein